MDHLKLLRPRHWIKNGFIFLPVFFAGEFLQIGIWPRLIVGFIAFSCIASGVYVLNDYRDRESDRLHPEKSKRPLAANKVSPKLALIVLFALIAAGLTLAWLLDPAFFYISGIYLIINILYSFGLKNISILDILLVAVGFNIRLKAGGILGDVPLSVWINIMVFLLAIFIAVGKRRDDILIKEKSGVVIRKSLNGYNLPFLNAWLMILTAIIIVSYLMYTLSPEVMGRLGTHRLYYTGIFVIAGLMRYLQLVYIDNKTASPIKILYTDRFIQGVLICWIIAYFIIIYLPNDILFK